jgi:hypothetical protein
LQATKAALAAESVTLSLGEGFLIMPGLEINDARPTMDVMAELGAPMVNTIVMEPDRVRAFDQFAAYSAMAAERNMRAALEFMPFMWPIDFAEAVQFVSDAGAANACVLVDAMHFFRSGSQLADLAAQCRRSIPTMARRRATTGLYRVRATCHCRTCWRRFQVTSPSGLRCRWRGARKPASGPRRASPRPLRRHARCWANSPRRPLWQAP